MDAKTVAAVLMEMDKEAGVAAATALMVLKSPVAAAVMAAFQAEDSSLEEGGKAASDGEHGCNVVLGALPLRQGTPRLWPARAGTTPVSGEVVPGADVAECPRSHASSGSNNETLAAFLAALSLGQWELLFMKEAVTLEELMLLSDADLQAIGIPMGPRCKIQAALACCEA